MSYASIFQNQSKIQTYLLKVMIRNFFFFNNNIQFDDYVALPNAVNNLTQLLVKSEINNLISNNDFKSNFCIFLFI